MLVIATWLTPLAACVNIGPLYFVKGADLNKRLDRGNVCGVSIARHDEAGTSGGRGTC